MKHPFPLIALTGGFACGKSTVLRMFEKFGARVFSADAIARELSEGNDAVKTQIRQTFGEGVFDPATGLLDRKKLGEIVFSDINKRRQLENILHPAIRSELIRKLSNLPLDTPMVVYEVPLLFETMKETDDPFFDCTVAVISTGDVVRERAHKRDQLTSEQIISRVQAQLPNEEKAKRADFVIQNDGSIEELQIQVSQVAQELERRFSHEKS